MYRLFIVDDEKFTRDSLRDLISRDKLGISQIITAKNGIEALKLAKAACPDIILTDIRMPKMNGLELATQIRALYPDCKIIFLTGYADKGYLKTAIHLKAVSYIEKPLNPEEVRAAIQETVALCEAESQREQTMARLKNYLDGSAPLIRQAITLELVNKQTDLACIATKYSEFCPPLRDNDRYTVAYAVTHWNTDLGTLAINRYQQALLTTLSSETFAKTACFTAGFDPTGNLVLIFYDESKVAQTPVNYVLTTLLNQFDQITEARCRLTVGVGDVVTGPAQIPLSYQAAVSATVQQFYNAQQRIFYPTPCGVGSASSFNKMLLANFKNNLKEDDFEAAKAFIKELTEKLAVCYDYDLNRVKNIYFQLMLILLEVARERELIDPFSVQEKTYIWKEIEVKTYLDELSQYVVQSIDGIFGKLNDCSSVLRKINDIIRFIHQNYADKSLSLQSISAHIYLSPTYLCAFFKKSTGKTLNEFITETRINKAKELLKDFQVKLYEVATAVGFTDVNYFSTLFKRCTGYTPSDFRKKYYR